MTFILFGVCVGTSDGFADPYWISFAVQASFAEAWSSGHEAVGKYHDPSHCPEFHASWHNGHSGVGEGVV